MSALGSFFFSLVHFSIVQRKKSFHLDWIQCFMHSRWNTDLCKVGDSPETIVGLNRHNARDDGTGDAKGPTLLLPVEKSVDVIKSCVRTKSAPASIFAFKN